ncbi:MAG TPA: tetratricopeptide repeat protein [Candidatus Limnocylindrales bacterium]|nr:tetratricopeptide repeat protein [Candidatus Limnocylindrales bacterium]
MPEDTRSDSIAMFERIVSQDPSSPLYLPLAERMREQGRVDQAIRLCEERRGRPGQGVGDHIVLGRCYLAAGRLTEARSQFETAVSLDRENVVALKALGGILSHQGQHGSASDFYRAVCRIDPGDLESQTALHQITSGEFPEVRPPDLVIEQGETTWQPVQPPREEEYLSEISLGLHTIESFDVEAPKPGRINVQDFQEMAFDALDVEAAVVPAAPPAAPEPPVAAIAEDVAPPEAEYAPPVVEDTASPVAEYKAPPEPAPTRQEILVAQSADDDPSSRWTELPRTPVPVADGPRVPKTEVNKSAFETWVTRLKGRS